MRIVSKPLCLCAALVLSLGIVCGGCSQTKTRVADTPYSVTSGHASVEGEAISPSGAHDDSSSLGNRGNGPGPVLSPGEDGEKRAKAESSTEEGIVESPQSLMDNALDFYEASQEYWNKGSMDKAMEALDQAYDLIFKVEADDNPELVQQKDDLRYTLAKRILEIYASRYSAVSGNHKAIPLTMNIHVKREIKLLLGRERRFLIDSYKRSGRYRGMMVAALKEAGLPEELSWLPLIESGFKVNAFSRARALGLWQFIPSTGYKFGLSRDTWIDERLDPEKATAAAISYLRELHKIFGDWTTVLAAYNVGEGTVLRVIRGQRINYLDNFWDLYERLPTETARYVPKFLALLHILKDPAKYGITLPDPDSPVPYETVIVGKPVRLKDVAKKLGMSFRELRALNPELRRQATPDRDYSLKVPPGKGEVVTAKIDLIPRWSPPMRAYTFHRVRRGQTLSYLAVKYRTTVSAIARTNRISRKSLIRVGQKLKIPLGRWALRGIPASVASLPGGKYRVRRGDTLWLIAQRFRTNVRSLQRMNNLRSTTLRVGQVLKITGKASSKKNFDGLLIDGRYRVKEGDSLWLIARKFKTDAGTLKRLNNLKSNMVYVGQLLQVGK